MLRNGATETEFSSPDSRDARRVGKKTRFLFALRTFFLHEPKLFAATYLVITRYMPLQTRSTPIMYRRVSGSRSRTKPAILVSSIPPNRITGEPSEIGAPALKVTYSPRVTPLKANPIPVLAKIPESWACCGIPRAHCQSTQVSPVENVQQPYISISRLLEILPAANFTQRSAAANAHAVTAAYFIQPMIQICPPIGQHH